jgi:AcrR family transcriptional regulator
MAVRRRRPARTRNRPPADEPPTGERGAAREVVRRAPFSDNPAVGPRGLRTQQRILDAALQVFGEDGYYKCSIDRIAKVAGCSRVSFYQYFGSKEDVFRNLAGQVARQLNAATEALDALTPDADGWKALRSWIARQGDVHERYEAVYRVFPAAYESDDAVAVGSTRYGERTVERVRARLATTTLPIRQLDAVIRIFMECRTQTLDIASMLRSVAPHAYPRERIEDALADVFHRTLFGLQPDVNVHPPARTRPPRLEFDAATLDLLGRLAEEPDVSAAGQRARTALIASGRDVFARRGYHGTRVDDLVAAAGVSHGAFYRYFRNKDHLARVLTGRAMRTVSSAFAEVPDLVVLDGAEGRVALRRWLRRYNALQASEAAMLRVWVDAALEDAALSSASAAPFDWGRRRMARVLRERGFGDVDSEAVVMVGLLSAFGGEQRPAEVVDATASVIERGLLAR